MKPELVFPLILASYSEDKIARELLNNDSIIKTAGWLDFLRRPLSLGAIRFGRWLSPNKRRGGSTRESTGKSKGGPKPPSESEQVTGPPSGAGHPSVGSGILVATTNGQERSPSSSPPAAIFRDKGEQIVDVLHRIANNPDAIKDPNALKEILQANNLTMEEMKKVLPSLLKIDDIHRTISDVHGPTDVLIKETNILNELKAMGINPNALEKFRTINPDKLGKALYKLDDVISGAQAVSTAANQAVDAAKPADAANQAVDAAKPADAANQAVDAAKPADAANQAVDAAKPADAANQAVDANQTAKTEDKDKSKGSSLLRNIMLYGSAGGSGALMYHILSSMEDEKKRENENTLNYTAAAAGNLQNKPPGLNRPRQRQDNQGPPVPKTEINPLLAAGLGALLVGGLAQRNFGNEEGHYPSLGPALLPMLAGGLIGYGGAEAINNNNPSV
jgi:hypothetical protein